MYHVQFHFYECLMQTNMLHHFIEYVLKHQVRRTDREFDRETRYLNST